MAEIDGGQALATAFVDVGVLQPAVQRRVGDAEIRSEVRDRLLTQPR